jgi:hypothetical protein
MFIARKADGTIYGAWTVRQFDGQEELADSDPQLIAFLSPKPPLDISDRPFLPSSLYRSVGVVPHVLRPSRFYQEREVLHNPVAGEINFLCPVVHDGRSRCGFQSDYRFNRLPRITEVLDVHH